MDTTTKHTVSPIFHRSTVLGKRLAEVARALDARQPHEDDADLWVGVVDELIKVYKDPFPF